MLELVSDLFAKRLWVRVVLIFLLYINEVVWSFFLLGNIIEISPLS
jgi:hypothetical protein